MSLVSDENSLPNDCGGTNEEKQTISTILDCKKHMEKHKTDKAMSLT